MEKKSYMMPQTSVVEIEIQELLAGSQYDVPVNDPSDEVDAGEALSRRRDSMWEDCDED
jgi:hypothetical protein